MTLMVLDPDLADRLKAERQASGGDRYDEVWEGIRARGHEVGTTTGRPRRVGWFDAVPIRYAVAVNSVSSIMLNKIDILLIMGPNQVVKRMSRDRQHWLSLTLGVIQAIEEMNSARSQGGEANTETPRVLCVPARSERGSLLVPDLNEPDLGFARPQSFKDSIHAVAGESKNYFDAPIDEPFDE